MDLHRRYIYCDEIEMKNIEMAINLYYAAKKYMLPHLFKTCGKYIMACLKPGNACQIYEIAKQCDDTSLMEKSLKVLLLMILLYFFNNFCNKCNRRTKT